MSGEIRVEYWKIKNNELHNIAQMRKNLDYIKPDSKDIHRRFFSNRKDAQDFATAVGNQGYHTKLYN